MLEIIYQDDFLVAINKPHGLLVHKTKIAEEKEEFALQILRDQIGRLVFPCHRIDRKTGGVLLFALDVETEKKMKELFAEKMVEKYYHCLVRGYFPDHEIAERPLENEKGKLQDAMTEFFNLASVELPVSVSRYPTSRYSLVLAKPHTGRTHQIRRHLAQLRHYIVGDRTHGECKQNNMFRDRFGLGIMMLHAWKLGFQHPVTHERVCLTAPWQREFSELLAKIEVEESAVLKASEAWA